MPSQSMVKLILPITPIKIGSFLKVPVKITPGSGYSINDLDFVVLEGSKGGSFSLSRDQEYNPKHPDIMLLVGFKPGMYTLQVFKKGSTSLLSEAKFTTTAKRLDKAKGPSIWFEGIVKGNSEARAWNGETNSPQNFNIYPASGTRRMAIVLVDSASERFTTDLVQLNAIRKLWKDAAQDGLQAGGKIISVAHYFREVSYNNFNVTADVFGPYHFDETWNEIFGPQAVFGFMQQTITIADADINYNNYDTIVGVMKSFTTATPERLAVWPNASVGLWGPYLTSEGSKSFGAIAMPDDWGTVSNNNLKIVSTLAHELGHNLGLTDLYKPPVPNRNLSDWDLMSNEGHFPHFSIAHRLMLGWVQPGWLSTFNFVQAGSPVDQTVSLDPIELGTPTQGRKAGIEVRIANGWNYYLEYRKSQPSQIGDQSLPTDDRVLGTDVISAPYNSPIVRPVLLILDKDSDGDGPVLGNGQNYKELRYRNNTGIPVEMRIDVNGINSMSANVRIRYGVIGNPDPSIRPWAPPPWQSPDIEIRNERNLEDPVWFNVAWDDHDNTVVAKVHNNGNLDATDVVVNFYVKDANIGGAPETFLGADTKTIPAGQTVEFTTNWRVPREGHYCIAVRIPIYVIPGSPPVAEMTELNNLAQSNYDRFISRSASPPSREIALLTVRNPYPKPTYIVIAASQNDGGNIPGNKPYYRTYLEHTWLYLKAGEAKKIKVMFEGTGEIKLNLDKRFQNDVQIVGYVYDPAKKPMRNAEIMAGWQTRIEQARAVEFTDFSVQGLIANGTIRATDNGQPVTTGKVIITETLSNSTKEHYTTVSLKSNGNFTANIPKYWKSVTAYYVPGIGFGDAKSKRINRIN